ncbi:MAG: hypothetical protein V8R83_02395 [Candidatus Gastranaerophilaceae bacterium]
MNLSPLSFKARDSLTNDEIRSSHLESTEQTIKFLYSKYGLEVFENQRM